MQKFTEKDIKDQIKPLSTNTFVALFQKIWRKWLAVWYQFSDNHPKLSKLMYQLAFFFIFSMSVTLFQYLLTLFLPMMFGLTLAGTEFLWPKIPMYQIGGVQKYWTLLGYDIAYDKVGEVMIGGGLGYFIAFEIATFLAQCINFPLQRNITFRSHGNPYIQITWYFIGWVLTSLFCNAINSLWLPLGAEYLPFAVYNILTMISMGGISMVIFFFIFLIIFPDYNVAEKRLRAKLEQMKKKGVPMDKIEKVEEKLAEVSKKAALSNAEKVLTQARAQASAKAMNYFAVVKNAELSAGELKNSRDEKVRLKAQACVEKSPQKIQRALDAAVNALQVKQDSQSAFDRLKKENDGGLKETVSA